MITTDKRFISEIEGFQFPNGLLNKKIPGCGATEFAITNNEPTVILSPRLGLIESKVKQHPELLEVKAGVSVEDIKAFKGKKIISTYDSFYKIKEAINLTEYRILCDEVQFLIKDSAFKSGVIRRMLEDLQDLPKVTYISATPLEGIIKNISYFKNILYEEINWVNIAYKEKLNMLEAVNPIGEAVKLCKAYSNGIYQEGTDSIVLFINSINGICNIIKNAKLTPENTNVLMANTSNNVTKLNKVGFERGNIPNKGESYKPITLCTSAYAAGADFYNKKALLYIISDVYLTKPFSIADEIPQIAGRLRLGNKGIYLVYKIGKGIEVPVEVKRQRTLLLMESYNTTSDIVKEDKIKSLERDCKTGEHSEDYLYYNTINNKFEEDELALNSDIYNKEIIKSYKNGITLSKGLSEDFNLEYKEKSTESVKMVDYSKGFQTAIKTYLQSSGFEKAAILINYPQIEDYCKKLTEKQIKAVGYQEKRIKQLIENNEKSQDIKLLILNTFKKNTPVKEVKQKLQEIYNKRYISKKAKATDIIALLPDYFNIKKVRFEDKTLNTLIRIK